MKIALAQINATVGDIDGNTAQLVDAARQARERGANILLTPELVVSGYPAEDLWLREDLQQRVEQALVELCAHSHGITLVVGHPHRVGKELFNAASVLRDGAVLMTYHKFSLPNHTVFDERRYFVAGERPCVFEQAGIRFGVTICADVWHEPAARSAADAGAQVLLVLNASPYHFEKQGERYDVVRDRIEETGLPVVYCNLVGGQDELVFDGASFAMNTHGEVTSQFPPFETGVYEVELDGIRLRAGPVAEPLPAEAMLWKALGLGLRDYVTKNRFPGVLLGLSGGIDSALVLALAVDVLGAGHVHAVMMPSPYTADISLDDARTMANGFGVKYTELPIAGLFSAFLHELAPVFAGLEPDVTEENIQARIRGTLLMALSNKSGDLLLATGNKSEMAVGYATLYGDMAGGFAPLRDVSKTWVYRLSRWRNGVAPAIPQRVIERPPSAELRPGQTDQDTLPDYGMLDAIIERYVEWDQSVEAMVAAGLRESDVRRVVRMIDRSEYKRRQAAPGVRITERAFGKDRRYPITQRFVP